MKISNAFKALLKRNSIDAAHYAEELSYLLTQHAQEQAANALALLAVQLAPTAE